MPADEDHLSVGADDDAESNVLTGLGFLDRMAAPLVELFRLNDVRPPYVDVVVLLLLKSLEAKVRSTDD